VFKETPDKRFQQTFSKRYHLRPVAYIRGNVAEGSPKQLVQTLTGVTTQMFETGISSARVGTPQDGHISALGRSEGRPVSEKLPGKTVKGSPPF